MLMISYVMEAFVCKITSVNCFLVVGRARTILFDFRSQLNIYYWTIAFHSRSYLLN